MTKIRVGQRWRSRDKRDNGRIVSVLWVSPSVTEDSDGRVTVLSADSRQYGIRARTLRSRYSLVAADLVSGVVSSRDTERTGE